MKSAMDKQSYNSGGQLFSPVNHQQPSYANTGGFDAHAQPHYSDGNFLAHDSSVNSLDRPGG